MNVNDFAKKLGWPPPTDDPAFRTIALIFKRYVVHYIKLFFIWTVPMFALGGLLSLWAYLGIRTSLWIWTPDSYIMYLAWVWGFNSMLTFPVLVPFALWVADKVGL